MLIEDASAEWKESESPFRKVATVRIPVKISVRRDAGVLRRMREPLVHPRHALAEHRPLGGLNRLRRVAYEVSLR